MVTFEYIFKCEVGQPSFEYLLTESSENNEMYLRKEKQPMISTERKVELLNSKGFGGSQILSKLEGGIL